MRSSVLGCLSLLLDDAAKNGSAAEMVPVEKGASPETRIISQNPEGCRTGGRNGMQGQGWGRGQEGVQQPSGWGPARGDKGRAASGVWRGPRQTVPMPAMSPTSHPPCS